MSALLWIFWAAGCSRAEPPVPTSPSAVPEQPAPEPAPSPAPVVEPAEAGTIVAVGDLHGDLDNALDVLRLAGIVDDGGHWAAGDATFVQTGDTTDRGPDSRDLLALMRRLQTEADAAGGRVIPLLGNHEVMNLVGDWRYVHPGDVERYGGVEPRKAAFAPGGEDGRWLRSLDVATKVGDTVFVHGGIAPAFAEQGLDAVNEAVRQALATGAARAPVLGPEGPLWYRGYVQEPEATACPTLAKALDALDAERMVVGHTTRRDGRLQARCGGALVVIDIGIADHYGGNYGALQITDDDGRAVYPSGPRDLPDPD